MTRDEPVPGLGEAAQQAAYLAFFRDTVVAKCRSVPPAALRETRLPSGWTPLELVFHLLHMEQRWFVWGFLGEPVPEPWGDSQGEPDAPWLVPDDVTLDDVVHRLDAIAGRTEEVLATRDLDEVAATTGRFADTPPPDLRWICLHVLQEYARHAGHLDVAVELAGGAVGE